MVLFPQSIPRFPTESPDLTSPTQLSFFFLSLFSPPPSLVLPSTHRPSFSTYRMLRHSGEIYGYFTKWLNALPDYGWLARGEEEQRMMQRERQRKRKDRQQWLRYRLSATINRHRRCLSLLVGVVFQLRSHVALEKSSFFYSLPSVFFLPSTRFSVLRVHILTSKNLRTLF